MIQDVNVAPIGLKKIHLKYREKGNTARFVNAGRIKKTVLTLLTESIFVDLLLRYSIFWQIIGMMQFPFSVW